MGRVKLGYRLPGTISAAEALWYDVGRWPAFVDGFSHVTKTEGDWPHEGARVLWQSTPGGRGLVVERVTAYEVRASQAVEVEDPRMTGEQVVTFSPDEEGGCSITVDLRYQLKERTPFTPVVDFFFVRRAMADSVRRTLGRFARELAGDLNLAREQP